MAREKRELKWLPVKITINCCPLDGFSKDLDDECTCCPNYLDYDGDAGVLCAVSDEVEDN